ncbi:MAG: TIM barrel protein [Candidatus Woesearchaeota archaeon]
MAEYIASSYLGRMSDEYFSSLDKGMYVPDRTGTIGKPIAGVKDLGIPTPPMQDQVQSLKQRIHQGASLVELGFMGSGKGSMGQGSTTPEMYGYDQRQAMRELAKANEMRIVTHATTRLPPLSGFGQQGFNEEARRQALEEIERTVDFAADVARGGPVTVHTGEFNRRISTLPGTKKGRFDRYASFEEKTPEYFVDERTGQVVQEVKPTEPVVWTEMERNPDGSLKTDEYGQFIPRFDPEQGGFNTRPLTDQDITDLKNYYSKQLGREVGDDEVKARARIETQMRNATGWGVQSQARVESDVATIKRLEEDRAFLSGFWDRIDDEQKETHRQAVLNRYFAGREPPLYLRDADAYTMLNKLLEQEKAGLKYNQDVASQYLQEAEKSKAVLENLNSVEGYAKKKTADTIAQAAVYAMDKSQTKNLFGEKADKPIFIAPENIFPEQYGSHPEELREMVTSSRERMKDYLVNERKMNEKDAEKKARDHIKATFDIGHANMWKKYYGGKEEDFNKWVVDQAEKLAKEGIIGHVHVSDNFGYNDEHLSPGQGTAPINDFVERMRKHGLKNVIIEPSHNDFEVLREGWRTMAGSITQNFSVANDRWVNIEHSYFGRTSGPYFLVGETAPSQDGYQLWSGVPFE